MYFFDEIFIDILVVICQNEIKGTEMVHGFDDVITVNDFISVAENGMGVKKIHCMFMAQFATLDPIAVIVRINQKILF